MRTQLTRRALLKTGAAVTIASLLHPCLRFGGLAQAATAPRRRVKNVILLWLNGGPSHLDTFDTKPGTAFSGPFAAIPTAVDGITLCEHLPQLAQRARRLAIVRSLTSGEADHDRADHLMHTGHLPTETVDHPWVLSVASQALVPTPGALPTSVAIGGTFAGGGCLGQEHSPFEIPDPDDSASGFQLPEGIAKPRQERRLDLLATMNREFAARTGAASVASGAALWQRAAALIGDAATAAFDLGKEPDEVKAKYGDSPFGRGCLLARRLVEHGVRFVEVTLDGWDTHTDNFTQTQALMGQLDPAFAALLDDLEAHGQLDETLVLCTGEFGRTPEINPDNGRDHHSAAFSAVLAGGGVQGGQVIGATNESGHEVKDRPVTIPDLLATLYAALGLDPHELYETPEGRPIKRLDTGEPIAGLFA